MASLIAYIFYFIAASASPLQRRWLATKRSNDSGQIDFAFKVMSITVLLSLSLPLFSPLKFTGGTLHLAMLSAIAGVFGAVVFTTQYIAQRHVEAGLTTLTSNVYTPVTILLASTFLHERLQLVQVFGTILLLFSVLLVSNKHKLSKWRFDRYFWLMVISGVALGVVLTSERALIKTTGFTAGTWLSWWSQCLLLGSAALLSGTKSQYNLKDTSITGVLRFLQSLSWVILITVVANLSVVSAITTFKVVVIFVAAAILLYEREDFRRKIVGSLIATVGLMLML